MRIKLLCLVAIISSAAVNANERVVDERQEVIDRFDALSAEMATMSDEDLANALNLNDAQASYILEGLVDKAKSLISGAKDFLTGAADKAQDAVLWASCKSLFKLTPLTNVICKIHALPPNPSSQQILQALKDGLYMK